MDISLLMLPKLLQTFHDSTSCLIIVSIATVKTFSSTKSVKPSRRGVYQVSELLKPSSICGRNCLPLIYRFQVGGSVVTDNPSISLIIPNILKALLRIWSSSKSPVRMRLINISYRIDSNWSNLIILQFFSYRTLTYIIF